MVDPVTGKQMEYDPNVGYGMPVMQQQQPMPQFEMMAPTA